MVMAKRSNMMHKNLTQTIRKSLGRFVAIAAIIALGAGLFVGLLTTKTDMVETSQWFTDGQNMFDLRLLNTYGWTQAHVEAVREMPGVAEVEGAVGLDALMHRDRAEDSAVYHLLSIPETINRVSLREGRMPQSPDECLADGTFGGKNLLGTQYTVSRSNSQDTLDALTCETYTVVGTVASPLYLNTERGNTSLGNGRVASFLYLLPEGFQTDYYTDIYVTIPGAYTVYTEEYDDAMDRAADTLEPLLEPLAKRRLEQVRTEAEEAYADGLAEYEQGLADYEQGKKDAEKELADGKKKLTDGQAEIDANRKTLEDGRKQLEEGQTLIDENAALLLSSRETLTKTKSDTYTQLAEAQAELMERYKEAKTGLSQVESGLRQIESALTQLDSGIAQLEAGLEQIDAGIRQIDALISILDPSLEAARSALDFLKNQPDGDLERIAQLEAQLEELEGKRDGYVNQKAELETSRGEYGDQLSALQTQREEVAARQTELHETRATIQDGLDQIDMGFMELQSNQTQADNQFAAAQAELDAGQMKLDASQKELDSKKAELEAGEAALAEAQAELDAGWEEYEQGKLEADRELADGKRALDDAKKKLADARQEIDALKDPSVYALTRNTNIGYVSMESDSDIVAGVSRVFPAFFLLVAALVCITSMTRMVNEERTQIGTFKALGYSNGETISKYLKYSGASALLGCTLGVLIGSVAFPQIIWQGYRIIHNFTPWLKMRLDWPLCLSVVLSYTSVVLLVTWYACHKELKETPAELIRPKAPAAGKRVILEKLPFWNKIGFLNKVAIRNVFRYRQRLLMMLLGIGGCTALLMTGFGIRDSIFNIVDYQFEEVTVYDMSVSFRDNQSLDAQSAFRESLLGNVDQILFCHESSAELDYGGKVKEVYLLASDDRLKTFVDLHHGSRPLEMPGSGEALVCRGAAEAMGIDVGDTVTLRNPDMEEISLKVVGIYDNNVYNYVIADLQTIRLAWGSDYGEQTALITTREEQDPHIASARIMDMDGVLNVLVSQDLASQVGSMMDAMNLIVITVVACAGMLALIVLYNLTNININERVREIATLKVLGFRAGETAAYVFKENLSLSVVGALLGLVGGKFLLNFVMSQIKLDMVWFQSRVSWISCVLSFVLTIVAACLVDLIFYFRLEKINMAEALKSVE